MISITTLQMLWISLLKEKQQDHKLYAEIYIIIQKLTETYNLWHEWLAFQLVDVRAVNTVSALYRTFFSSSLPPPFSSVA